ncbi:MAG: squalene/phytoene synthase family protein [Gammaproteobacteria bacterium]|nr:squalene/phytoene synthase family protein [Gammaproteobacteria bacterium]
MQPPELSPPRRLAWLYSSPPQRRALAALSAVEREIAGSLRPNLDHEVAHARLGWWREECERTARGLPRHPLTRELGAVFADAAGFEPLGALVGLVDTVAWDLARATFDTRAELTHFCERWSAALIVPLTQLAAAAASASTSASASASVEGLALGTSLREIELLLALASDARAGRLRVPLDELGRLQVPPESLAQPPWPAPLAALVGARHEQSRAAVAAAVDALGPEARAALRGLVVWAAVVCSASERAQARLPRASGPRGHHAPLDGWRAWRAARAAQRTFRG